MSKKKPKRKRPPKICVDAMSGRTKIKYPTKGLANDSLVYLKIRKGYTDNYVYQCDRCQQWHIATKRGNHMEKLWKQLERERVQQ